jgi:broad specificity phosphatase PhoE
LIRHGQSAGNVADEAAHAAHADMVDIDVRDPDVDLTELGYRQAEAVGRRWAHARHNGPADVPTVVWSSPFVRAAATASVAVTTAELDVTVQFDERLRERDLGVFDGLTRTGIMDRYPDEAARRRRLGKFYYRPPSGESWADLALRVRAFVRDVRTDNSGERVAVFSHQAVLLVFRYVVESLSEADVLDAARFPPFQNGGVTTYERQTAAGAGLTLLEHDATWHMDAEGIVPTEEHEVHAEV